jgi:hypothetical protein
MGLEILKTGGEPPVISLLNVSIHPTETILLWHFCKIWHKFTQVCFMFYSLHPDVNNFSRREEILLGMTNDNTASIYKLKIFCYSTCKLVL